MGLGLLMQTTYLLPLMVVSLIFALAALGYRANRRRGFGPVVVGAAAGVALLGGKFIIDSNVVMYGSLASLISASIWNLWPACSKAPLYQPGGNENEKS